MNINLIIVIAGYVLIAGIIPYLLLKSKTDVKKMGECIYSFSKKKNYNAIAVDIVAIILLTVLFFREFSTLSTVVLAGCCVLAVYIMTKDLGNQRNYGVYEEGMIVPNNVIFYDDIISFPVFQLPAEEQEHYAKNLLVVITDSKGKSEIVFSSEEECQEVIRILKERGIISDSE